MLLASDVGNERQDYFLGTIAHLAGRKQNEHMPEIAVE
jgi:hypothetical protein